MSNNSEKKIEVKTGDILVGIGKYETMPKGVEFTDVPQEMAEHLVSKGAATVKK